jgi:hypothetical protein
MTAIIFDREIALHTPEQRKPPTCRKSLTNFITNFVQLALIEIQTHNISVIGIDYIDEKYTKKNTL